MSFFSRLAESGLLALSLSTDAFSASLAYGAEGIRIPPLSAAVLSGVCSGILFLAMALGRLAGAALPEAPVRWISFALLLAIGLARLFENGIKAYIRRHNNRLCVNFAANGLCLILTVYADAASADTDRSQVLSPREAAVLAAALSLDGVAAGVGAAASGMDVLLPTAVSFVMTAAVVAAGSRLGRLFAGHVRLDLSVFSATLLVLLAFSRLI